MKLLAVGRLLMLSSLFLALPVSAEKLLISSGEERVHLLELYTSQGCSSCPPAEQWLNRFTADERLWQRFVPLAFHVDYWDYLGWKDPFSNARFSQRQQRYRQEGGVRAVYTPGLVLNGQELRSWYWQMPGFSGEPAPRLNLEVDTNGITASLDGMPQQSLLLNVALLGFDIETQVPAGENRGKKLPQEFVVLNHSSQRADNGRWQLPLPRPQNTLAARYALAAWVSPADNLRPIQAAGGWLPAELINSP